ncbi:MAG: hypothetical protein CBB71_03210 [Rhodopirellula sp. TMED11]|nr:MAG: hypothetical protein CBB71_03210 [Rhodopirellula sp. TMED11]
MKEHRKRHQRICRIRDIEQNRLLALLGELAKIENTLLQLQSKQKQLITTRDKQLETSHAQSVTSQQNILVWLERTSETIQSLDNEIQLNDKQRRQAADRISKKQTRIKSLERLAEQIQEMIKAELENQQMLIADENAMKDYARN